MTNIVIPSSVYLFVQYTEGLDQAATRASYGGIYLDVEYAPGNKTRLSFATGDFHADYVAACGWVEGFGQADAVIPFMASSTLDSYVMDAGYESAVSAANAPQPDDDIPFASDADLAALGDDDALARDRWSAALADDLPFLATTEAEKALVLSKALERAWVEVPAVKLQWTLAQAIVAGNSADEVLAMLTDHFVDERFGREMRP